MNQTNEAAQNIEFDLGPGTGVSIETAWILKWVLAHFKKAECLSCPQAASAYYQTKTGEPRMKLVRSFNDLLRRAAIPRLGHKIHAGFAYGMEGWKDVNDLRTSQRADLFPDIEKMLAAVAHKNRSQRIPSVKNLEKIRHEVYNLSSQRVVALVDEVLQGVNGEPGDKTPAPLVQTLTDLSLADILEWARRSRMDMNQFPVVETHSLEDGKAETAKAMKDNGANAGTTERKDIGADPVSEPVEPKTPAFDLGPEPEPQISKVEKEEAVPVSSEVEEPVVDVEEVAEPVEMFDPFSWKEKAFWIGYAAIIFIGFMLQSVTGGSAVVETETARVVAKAELYTPPVMPDLGEPEEENRLVEKVDSEPVLEGAELAKAMVDQGFELVRQGEPEMALRLLDKAQGVDGIQPAIYARSVRYMGKALTKLNRLEEAALKNAEAYHLYRKIPGTLGSRMLAKTEEARVYYLLKDYDRAEEGLTLAYDSKVTNKDIKFHWLGIKTRIDTAKGRYAEVMVSAKQSLELQTGGKYEANALSRMSFASVINGNLPDAHYYQSQSRLIRETDEYYENFEMYSTVSDIIYAIQLRKDPSPMVRKVENYLKHSPDAELEDLLEFARHFGDAIY